MAIRTHKQRAREPFPAPPTPKIYKHIAYSFVALTILIVFAALWFSSVRATVWLTVSREPTPIQTDVEISRNPGQGGLSGRVVQGVFETVQEFDVTEGEGRAVEGTTTGQVRIYNDFSREQPLVATTRLLASDGRLYHTREGVVVPAGGSVDVEAYADEDGRQYDFTKSIDFTIPGLSESMQRFVYAESITPFTGGSTVVRLLTKEDMDKAAELLRESILEEAKAKLRSEVNDARFTESAYIAELVDKNTSVSLGEEADSFLMSMKLNVTGVFYSKMDMEALVRKGVQENVPEGREIVSPEPSRLTFEVDSVDTAGERARIIVNAEVLTRITSAEGVISKEAILGLPIDQAEHTLEKVQGVDEAEVIVRPSWVRRLPTLKDHISVKVK